MINVDSKELQKLYIAYFGRPGDPSGVNYWLSRASESLNLKEISNELSRQEEYKYVAHDKSFDFKINKLYLNLFNRKADFDGLNYWMDMSNSHEYTIADIAYELIFLINKPYSINPEQEKKDRKILKNKILAAELFTEQISKSITLINLYQPASISPWQTGNAFIKVSNFLRDVSFERVSINNVNDVINSLSDVSLNILNNPAIEMKEISLSIPIYSSERPLEYMSAVSNKFIPWSKLDLMITSDSL